MASVAVFLQARSRAPGSRRVTRIARQESSERRSGLSKTDRSRRACSRRTRSIVRPARHLATAHSRRCPRVSRPDRTRRRPSKCETARHPLRTRTRFACHPASRIGAPLRPPGKSATTRTVRSDGSISDDLRAAPDLPAFCGDEPAVRRPARRSKVGRRFADQNLWHGFGICTRKAERRQSPSIAELNRAHHLASARHVGIRGPGLARQSPPRAVLAGQPDTDPI